MLILTKTIKTLLMILWLLPAIAIYTDGIMKASSPTAVTINSNRNAASISSKAKTTRLLNAALENQVLQMTPSSDIKKVSPSQVHCLVFKVGVELRPWIFAMTGCVTSDKVHDVRRALVAASSLVSSDTRLASQGAARHSHTGNGCFSGFCFPKQAGGLKENKLL